MIDKMIADGYITEKDGYLTGTPKGDLRYKDVMKDMDKLDEENSVTNYSLYLRH